MRLPAYPLVTCDPYFSIWSRTDLLTDSDTMLWCGIEKPIRGTAQIDGETFRFLGLGAAPAMRQLSVDVQPYVTTYVFQQNGVTLSVRFWTPLLLDDLWRLSLPVSFIDFTMDCSDGKDHAVTVTIALDEAFCYDRKPRSCVFFTRQGAGRVFAVMGQLKQKPLSASGDGVSADWGWFYLTGGKVTAQNGIRTTRTVRQGKRSTVCLGFDEGYAVEYFGDLLKPLWREQWPDFPSAMANSYQNRALLFSLLQKQKNSDLKI